MSVSTKFTTIVEESVSPLLLLDHYSLRTTEAAYNDPRLDDVNDWFDLPDFGKALKHYKNDHPGAATSDELTNITYAYKWMLDGFVREVNINMLTAVSKKEYLEPLRGLFEEWQPAKEAYSNTIKKLDALPPDVAFDYTKNVEEYRRVAHGAVEVITEGLQHINKLINMYTPATNQQVSQAITTDAECDIEYRFNNIPLNQAEEWFKQLTTSKSKNGDLFLTEEQVRCFIERAFIGVAFTEKLSINARHGDKGNVVGLFYLFYTHCITHQPILGKIDKDATPEKYTKLLTDYFDNWTFNEVKNNFRAGGNWRKPA